MFELALVLHTRANTEHACSVFCVCISLRVPKDMPSSPYAKMDGDFSPDKARAIAKLSAAQQANDVMASHHEGRKWSMTLALMTMKTGAFRELPSKCRTRWGGHDEDGINDLIVQSKITAAKEKARMQLRVASRRAHADPAWFNSEQKRINQQLWVSIGRPNLPQKRRQTGSPATPEMSSPEMSGSSGSEMGSPEMSSPDNVMDAILAA